MALSRTEALDATLRNAGIPIDGVSLGGNPPSTVSVSYSGSATQEQRNAGQAIVEGFDYRPRQDLTRAQIVQGIAGLTTAQQSALLRNLLSFIIRTHAAEAFDVLTKAGLPLAVDEVVP